MKKHILIGILALSIILSGVSVFANENIDTKDNQGLNLSKIEIYEKDGTIMLPLREVAEEILGLDIKWNDETRSVEIGSGPQWTSITIGKNAYFFARVAPFKLSQAPEITNNLTYVPIEFFTHVLKYKTIPEYEMKYPEEEILSGFIKDISIIRGNQRLLIAGDETTTGLDEAYLSITDETIVVDKEGKEFNPKDLKVGTKVKAVLPEIMAQSMPPQGTAVKIIVEDINVYVEKTSYKDNVDIKYPQIFGLGEKDQEINKKIEEFVKEIIENDIYKDIKLDYEISLLSKEKLSLVFRGSFNVFDTERNLTKSLNFDLKTGNEINYENYFKKDKNSQEKLEKVLNKTAKEQLNVEFEAEGRQLYFRGSQIIVFYYPLDDSVIYPSYLYLSPKDLQDLIK